MKRGRVPNVPWPKQWPKWGGIGFRRDLVSNEVLSEGVADKLVFHVSELLECGRDFRLKVRAMQQAVQRLNEDPEAVADMCGEIYAELDHLVHHVAGLRPQIRKLLTSSLDHQASTRGGKRRSHGPGPQANTPKNRRS